MKIKKLKPEKIEYSQPCARPTHLGRVPVKIVTQVSELRMELRLMQKGKFGIFIKVNQLFRIYTRLMGIYMQEYQIPQYAPGRIKVVVFS